MSNGVEQYLLMMYGVNANRNEIVSSDGANCAECRVSSAAETRAIAAELQRL